MHLACEIFVSWLFVLFHSLRFLTILKALISPSSVGAVSSHPMPRLSPYPTNNPRANITSLLLLRELISSQSTPVTCSTAFMAFFKVSFLIGLSNSSILSSIISKNLSLLLSADLQPCKTSRLFQLLSPLLQNLCIASELLILSPKKALKPSQRQLSHYLPLSIDYDCSICKPPVCYYSCTYRIQMYISEQPKRYSSRSQDMTYTCPEKDVRLYCISY